MHKIIILTSLLFISFIFLENCKKLNNTVIDKTIETSEIKSMSESVIQKFDNTPALGIYYGMKDISSQDGTMIRVYNDKLKETAWGPIYSPVIYIFSKEGTVLAKYNTIDLFSRDFWPGDIEITYNDEQNYFHLVFSLDAYGNYGTANINLNTNILTRDIMIVKNDSRKEIEPNHQELSGYENEGETLKKTDPYIFSKSDTEINVEDSIQCVN